MGGKEGGGKEESSRQNTETKEKEEEQRHPDTKCDKKAMLTVERNPGQLLLEPLAF